MEQSKHIFPLFHLIENNTYKQSDKIIVKISNPEMGLGVFATKRIEKGELIETCPMIPLSWRTKYHGDPQVHNYCYPNSHCNCHECSMHGGYMYMVLGYGMLYNHHDSQNAKWDFNFDNLIGNLIAKRMIKKDEEIFVNYGPNYFRNRHKYIQNGN